MRSNNSYPRPGRRRGTGPYALFTLCVLMLISSWKLHRDQPPTGGDEKVRYDSSLSVVNGVAFGRAGYTGKAVKVGIIDVGFARADQSGSLRHVFTDKRLLGYKDYVRPGTDSMFNAFTPVDWHGTTVWRLIAGVDPKTRIRYGLADGASFYLARTDHGEKEFRTEQEYFKAAIEWLHSQGVRLVHASIGYGFGFDNPAENYVPGEMDGKSSLIAQVVQDAIVNKKMIIINSTGNEGNNVWKIVTTPSDAAEVISVGAADAALGKTDYSSEGPDFLPYLKPDVSCFPPEEGTSFAAPVVTGMVACMLEKDPSLTSSQVADLIRKSGHLYPYGNNYLGYGIPDAERVLKLMDAPGTDFKRSALVEAKGAEATVRLGGKAATATVFHKKDKWIVLKQEKVEPNAAGQVTIRRPSGLALSRLVVEDKLTAKYHLEEIPQQVARTTVATPDRVVEIIWQ